MVSKPLLGVDVDLTICPSDKGWFDYLKYLSGFGKVVHRTDGMLEYDLSKMFPNVGDPYDYWRALDYSQFEPLEGSVEALEALSEHFDVVFISQHKGNHSKSKYYWIEEYFPFKKGVMLTKEKFLMAGAVVAMIDDRKEHLKGFDFNQRIWFNTPYTQTEDCEVAIKFNVWNDTIVDLVKEVYL